MFGMRRREFMTLLGGAAAIGWPVAARAQQAGPKRRVAWLMSFAESDPLAAPRVEAFERALQQFGWTATQNIGIEYHWTASNPDLMRRFANELAGLNHDVLLTNAGPLLTVLARETKTIPIVFVIASHPVGHGEADSVARPGRNTTGFPAFEFSMGGKWLGLLKEIAPSVVRVGIIFNPETAPYAYRYMSLLEAAATSLSVSVTAAPVRDTEQLERAVGEFGGEPGGGLIVIPDTFTIAHRGILIAGAAQHRLPAFYPFRLFVADGGLFYYGTESIELYRRAASYVDRILRGTSPAELPIQYPTKFELVINLKTAKALGIEVPATLLARADEVVE
jgi:putative tryptophan/tyrosine transport system substrate-binding protein